MERKPKEIDYRSVLIPVHGKLRGSQARKLGETLERLYKEGYDQVVLDLADCLSIDSVGALSIERALDLGQRLYLVVVPGFPLEDFLPPELGADPRLRFFAEVSEAVRHVRSKEESGLLLV